MKTTLLTRRLFSNLFSGICLAALTLGSASQLAMATTTDPVTISGTETSVTDEIDVESDSNSSDVASNYALGVSTDANLSTLNQNVSLEYTGLGYGSLISAAVYNNGVIGSIGEISISNESEESVGILYGVYLGTSGSITGGIAANIDVTADSGKATGLYISNGSSIGGDVSGDITVSASSSAYGIYSNSGTISGDITGNIKVTGTSTDSTIYIYGISGDIGGADVSGDVTVTATSASRVYGISSSNVGDISGDVSVSTVTGPTIYAIYATGTIGTISGDISAERKSEDLDGTTYALRLTSATSVEFGDGASLSATGAATNYAIYASSSLTMTANTAAAEITLTGDIRSSTSSGTALTIESGNYTLAGDSTTITAGSMSISCGASLTLTGNTTFTITDNTLTLDLSTYTVTTAAAIDEIASSAMLTINESASVSGLTSVNIVLGADSSWTDEMMDSIISDDYSALDGVSYTVYSGSTSGSELTSGTFASDSGSIPEPSTATLSLLALTALLARRRRKA